MKWLTGWIETIVNRIVDARLATETKPEIDYDRLVALLVDNETVYGRVASHIDLSDLADEINTDSIEGSVLEKIDIDDVARTVADNVETDDIARYVSENFEFDYSEFDIDYSSLANEIDHSDLASEVKDQIEINTDELAEEIDYEELAKALIKLASKSVETT